MTEPPAGPFRPFKRSMTLLPSPLAQSTLSEKAALYLDHVTDNLPVFLHSLRPRLDPWLTYSTTSFRSIAKALPFDVDEQTTAICAAVLVCILTIAAMSWSNPLSNLWRRTAPQVNDEDYSYITPDYIEPSANQTRYDPNVDNSEPDIICLRHRGTIYPLHFRAYAIDDGVLTVGALREEAARQTGANNPHQVRLLYKGNLLKDDSRSCKTEGLKQHSEVLCVVSEVGANTPSEVSDSSRLDGEDEDAGSPTEKSKKKRSKKKSKKKAPLPETARPESTPAPSSNPALPPNLKLIPGALEKLAALTGYLQQVLIPACDEFFADMPTDPKKRDFEYKKLSETILAQIMLKADGIEPDGNVEVRNARKALIKEAQSYLNRLDEAKQE
ncbi:hypothetical protein N7466_000312 [Penicillium verhagenii]|uniref:uncharacterized protein n=1 Tax=Penicillium verhagenii TaxID=1562060 RepID=UPI00254519F7|nr:uncharacterized protein N7466_000312 [Penicillium verhagenii]KAJ5947297.1 hypothetical protein N7466_000312 [Penicillium verhagenii]